MTRQTDRTTLTLTQLATDAIWTELERQFEADHTLCVVRSDSLVDGHPDMGAAAAAAVDAVLKYLQPRARRDFGPIGLGSA